MFTYGPWFFKSNVLFATVSLKVPMTIHNAILSDTEDSKEKAALKAKLRRLCEKKNGGEKCQVPDWVHEMWRKGDHMEMALALRDCNFKKAHTPKYTHTPTPNSKVQSSRSILPSQNRSIQLWQISWFHLISWSGCFCETM